MKVSDREDGEGGASVEGRKTYRAGRSGVGSTPDGEERETRGKSPGEFVEQVDREKERTHSQAMLMILGISRRWVMGLGRNGGGCG